MKKILQINTVINSGSTGHIAESIGDLVLSTGWESYIAFGRNPRASSSKQIRIGNNISVIWQVFITRLLDLHGLGCNYSTSKFIKKIEKIKPDLIHIHNIHGYYINYKRLFKYLSKTDIPIVWTFHDCWPITGHCAYYSAIDCDKWQIQNGCINCYQKKSYPSCLLFSNSAYNYKCKKKYFNLIKEEKLTIVTPSRWLYDEIGKSFLSHYRREVIYNGINLEIFKPVENYDKEEKKIILGVASVWDERKGLNDFIKLSKFLKEDEEIVLIGVTEKIIDSFPNNIKGIRRTESKKELAEWYSRALVYFNASVEETFGMTCVEAQACGTPIIAYNTTAIPETICEKTGIVVESRNVNAVYKAIEEIRRNGKDFYTKECCKRVSDLFSEEKNFQKYIDLYNRLV